VGVFFGQGGLLCWARWVGLGQVRLMRQASDHSIKACVKGEGRGGLAEQLKRIAVPPSDPLIRPRLHSQRPFSVSSPGTLLVVCSSAACSS